MRKGIWILGVGALSLLWLLSGGDAGGGGKKGEAPSPEKIMELMQKLGTPGPNHKLLEPFVGEFTCQVKMWMQPGKPPVTSEGTVSRKWILDGRFILERYEGKAFGKPFTGIGWLGYDNQKKKYTVAWIDSMSTRIMTAQGTYNSETKTFTYTGEEDSPFFGGPVKTRDLVRLVDGDTQVLEMFRQPKGVEEFKMMEITCKRKAKL
jgi:hypothetical protein